MFYATAFNNIYARKLNDSYRGEFDQCQQPNHTFELNSKDTVLVLSTLQLIFQLELFHS